MNQTLLTLWPFRIFCRLGVSLFSSAYTKFRTDPINFSSNATLGNENCVNFAYLGSPPINTSELLPGFPKMKSFPLDVLVWVAPSTPKVVLSPLLVTVTLCQCPSCRSLPTVKIWAPPPKLYLSLSAPSTSFISKNSYFPPSSVYKISPLGSSVLNSNSKLPFTPGFHFLNCA